LRKALGQLTTQIERLFPDLPNARWVALRLLDGDQRMIEAVESGELMELSRTFGNRNPSSGSLLALPA
jgi:ferrous iron transport protein B